MKVIKYKATKNFKLPSGYYNIFVCNQTCNIGMYVHRGTIEKKKVISYCPNALRTSKERVIIIVIIIMKEYNILLVSNYYRRVDTRITTLLLLLLL